MYDNYNYAEGSDTPDAPWNQGKNKAIERDIVAEFSLTRCCTTSTTNYYVEGDKYEGFYEVLNDVDWQDEYNKQHYTPLELINMYKKELEEKKKSLSNQYQINQIDKIISECESWDEEFNDAYEDK